MTEITEYRARPRDSAGAATGPAMPPPLPASVRAAPRVASRLVAVYLALGALALLPGIALRLELLSPDAFSSAWAGDLARALDDIRFGSGLRFWLGVTGAGLMASMLLYPLRKLMARGRALGRVAAWFHVHMIIGVAAPVLILYHCNFGHGGLNANVALWTMLTVTASGVIGHFVYARASADFYAGRRRATDVRESMVDLLHGLDAMPASRRNLVELLDVFEADLLTPRLGLAASLSARWRLERQRHHLAKSLKWHLGQCARELGLSADARTRLLAAANQQFLIYMRLARDASGRSIREQIWARWRLFHLPVFLVMVGAIVLHVVAVWNLDAPQKQATVTESKMVAPVAPRAKQMIAGEKILKPGIARFATLPVSLFPPREAPISLAELNAKAKADPVVAAKPAPATVAPPETKVADVVPRRPEPVALKVKSAAPVVAAPATPAPVIKSAPPADVAAVYAELEKRTADSAAPVAATLSARTVAADATATNAVTEPPMALGGSPPRTLEAQLADLKARKAAGRFMHALAETGFELIGRHAKVECAICHTKPLREARSEAPRACIACHKTDDVHRGRRPDCANCHTPERWGEIVSRN